MSKITSKLQVTIPKAIARSHGLAPGSEIEFESAGEVIRVVPADRKRKGGRGATDLREALRWFDEATKRQEARNASKRARLKRMAPERGWTRDQLYAERTDR